jgi:NSS family neurotransmitter:Na+ symporter
VVHGSDLGRRFGAVWLWTVRVVVFAAVLGTLALGLQTLFVGGAIVPPV